MFDKERTLTVGLEACLETPHSSKPAIIVRSFAAEVLRDFRVRQDQEAFLVYGFHNRIRNVRSFERVSSKEFSRPSGRSSQQIGVNSLRTQAGTFYPGIPVCDRYPSRESARRVLGHRVRRRANLGEQPRR